MATISSADKTPAGRLAEAHVRRRRRRKATEMVLRRTPLTARDQLLPVHKAAPRVDSLWIDSQARAGPTGWVWLARGLLAQVRLALVSLARCSWNRRWRNALQLARQTRGDGSILALSTEGPTSWTLTRQLEGEGGA